tara:strand:+ start:365 stop:547 length:183 start_codon:yes stop_codon:yes gene_type:complete
MAIRLSAIFLEGLDCSLQPINPKKKMESMGNKSLLEFMFVGFVTNNSRILDGGKIIFYTK